ncbi:TRAP transporter TatT component family protein [Thermodesulfobacteriota bacterium]
MKSTRRMVLTTNTNETALETSLFSTKILLCLFCLLVFINGCATRVMESFIGTTVDNLQKQTDIELVCEGAPSFLLLLDSLIESQPGDMKMLITGIQAYSAYAAALSECGRPDGTVRMARKAGTYSQALLSLFPEFQENKGKPLTEFDTALSGFQKDDLEPLFWGGYGWATELATQDGSPAALADLYKIEKIMLQVLEFDETYFHGAAHLFLGIYYGSRPVMFGGKPELSKLHFEKSLSISKRQFLSTQVAYAEYYARTTFNREQYAQLLQEVLDFPLDKRPDISLSNRIAQKKAQRLLAEIDMIF